MIPTNEPIILCGLGTGDEGKGTTTDAVARMCFSAPMLPPANVRFGGPQAAHHVLTPEGIWHCFAQFGASSLVPGAHTILPSHMLLDLETLRYEGCILEQKGSRGLWSRLHVDPDCRIITPIQRRVGRLREIARGAAAHGSCGMGVGETVLDGERGLALRLRDLLHDRTGRELLRRITATKMEEAAELLNSAPPSAELTSTYEEIRARSDAEALFYQFRLITDRLKIQPAVDVLSRWGDRPLLLEGAQGALLDRHQGFVPHVTKTTTTCYNAIHLLKSALPQKRPFIIGVLRAYGHRHGAGPFITEEETLRPHFDDPRNSWNRWQGSFRVGWLDLPALRYGIHLNERIDALSVTCLDRLSGLERIRFCIAYRAPDGQQYTHLPTPPSGAELTAFVRSCTPLWAELPGWGEEIHSARHVKNLPINAQNFLNFLASSEGLHTPIAVVSVGPGSHQKFLYSP